MACPGGEGTMNGDELRGLGARDPTPSAAGTDRSGPGANDPSTWRDRATNDGSTEESPRLRWALQVAIKFLDILLDALQYIEPVSYTHLRAHET